MTDLVWLFGRGASIACGLRWTVPPEWQSLDRAERIRRIVEALTAEMRTPDVTPVPYRRLLDELAPRTLSGGHHLFATTNWDTLLESAIDALGLTYAPEWLPETHVYHLNGTIEAQNSRRSPILLEDDPPSARTASLEADSVANQIAWVRRFVVIGVSFACPMDRAFLGFLHSINDEVPIGFSQWLVVNPYATAALEVASRISASLPNAKVWYREAAFGDWLDLGMPELVSAGILSP